MKCIITKNEYHLKCKGEGWIFFAKSGSFEVVAPLCKVCRYAPIRSSAVEEDDQPQGFEGESFAKVITSSTIKFKWNAHIMFLLYISLFLRLGRAAFVWEWCHIWLLVYMEWYGKPSYLISRLTLWVAGQLIHLPHPSPIWPPQLDPPMIGHFSR